MLYSRIAAIFRIFVAGSMVDLYFDGITVPEFLACSRETRPWSRSAWAMYRTPGSRPGEDGFSPRLEGAPSTVRCWCSTGVSETAAVSGRTPPASARVDVLMNDLRVSDSILIL